MNKLTVSIIIPSYNEKDNLTQTCHDFIKFKSPKNLI